MDAFARKPVHVRCVSKGMAHDAQRVPALIIGQNENEIGTLRLAARGLNSYKTACTGQGKLQNVRRVIWFFIGRAS